MALRKLPFALVAVLLMGTLLFMGIFPVHSQTRKSGQASAAASREQDMVNAIKSLEDELRVAMVTGNATWWNNNLSSEYTETDANGKVMNKSETVAKQQSKYLIYETLDFGDRAVHTFNGDTVIVTGKMTVQGTDQGQSISGNYQFTRVWVKQGLEWKLASRQETKIAP